MIGFFQNKKRMYEVKKLISSESGMTFYGQPVLNKKYNRYDASIIFDYENPNWSITEKKLRKLFDKWRIQDIKGGVLDKVEFGYLPEYNSNWYISKENFSELVKLGLKVKAPLHHADALRFLEGICNGAVYTDDCEDYSRELKKRMNDRFPYTPNISSDNGYQYNMEQFYKVAHYAVDMAIDIVKKRKGIKN